VTREAKIHGAILLRKSNSCRNFETYFLRCRLEGFSSYKSFPDYALTSHAVVKSAGIVSKVTSTPVCETSPVHPNDSMPHQ
jgi:hypothetical protein